MNTGLLAIPFRRKSWRWFFASGESCSRARETDVIKTDVITETNEATGREEEVAEVWRRSARLEGSARAVARGLLTPLERGCIFNGLSSVS